MRHGMAEVLAGSDVLDATTSEILRFIKPAVLETRSKHIPITVLIIVADVHAVRGFSVSVPRCTPYAYVSPLSSADRPSHMCQVLREPWWVLPAEVLHGLTFATMWAATVAFAQEIAPGTCRHQLPLCVLPLIDASMRKTRDRSLRRWNYSYYWREAPKRAAFRFFAV